MRKLPLYLGLLIAFGVPGAVAAQEEEAQEEEAPPTLRLSFYQCDLSQMGPTGEQIETMEIPIWEELVDEGMVDSYGHFFHAWASEWNVGIYTVADNIEAVLAATEEFGNRMQERHPDADAGLNQVCPSHRDGFYVFGPRTGDDEDEGEDEDEGGS
jgi:hypothetical protein